MTNVRRTEFRDPAACTAQAAEELQDAQSERMVLNMGPSHPATHGVLRIVLELDGEIITKADPDVGYLHRGDEKISENMTYTQFIPYTDRLDYLAPLANNVAYCPRGGKIARHRKGFAAALPIHPRDVRGAGAHFLAFAGHRRLRDGFGRGNGVPADI